MGSQQPLPLDHLDRMTDSTGLIQHAIYCLPRRESGYTTDDNARALRLCVRLWDREPEPRMLARISCYLSFLEHARCPVRGFHNFLSYQRGWLDAAGTGDCQGQAVLALAETLTSRLPAGFHLLARELLNDILPMLAELRSLRAQAYLVQAACELWRAGVDGLEDLDEIAQLAADRLVDCYRRSHRPDWQWYESRLTYANAVLPHALFDAAERWANADYLAVAEESFGFLDRETTADGVFWPVGNRDWFSQGEAKSPYDQQPVEASTMASAALAGMKGDDERRYDGVFARACAWFHGQNSLGTPLADPFQGGCFDGLQAEGLNLNQGAESTLAYLWTELLTSSPRPGQDCDPVANSQRDRPRDAKAPVHNPLQPLREPA